MLEPQPLSFPDAKPHTLFLHAHFKTQPLSQRKDKDSINQHEAHFMLRRKFSSKTRTDPGFTFNSIYISTNAAIHPRERRAVRGHTEERTDRTGGADGRPARREAAGPAGTRSGRPGSERPATPVPHRPLPVAALGAALPGPESGSGRRRNPEGSIFKIRSTLFSKSDFKMKEGKVLFRN